jgi:ubiquinone/menaquinone biosynthesis C-methylase UbiE
MNMAGASRISRYLGVLRCPVSHSALLYEAGELRAVEGNRRYRITESGIPLFAEEVCRDDARAQQLHYDKVAASYLANLGLPHTQEYMAFLDEVMLKAVDLDRLGLVCELCCGHGEALKLLEGRALSCLGVDISSAMLEAATSSHPLRDTLFMQADVTMLPLCDGCVDSVFMLGGIHHVNDRARLFSEVARILKPGGVFYFREPVSDFVLWRGIRHVIYRLSPALDHATERPLLYVETVPLLERAGLVSEVWSTHGFLGFCAFMNSDILIFNRAFQFIPGIRPLVRAATKFDELCLRIPGMARYGLQVVGRARKSNERD